jgi:hypothetical protein
MSVIGISPTDIVGGVRLANKAVSALRKRDGAEERYQSSAQNHENFYSTIKALHDACDPDASSEAASQHRLLEDILREGQRLKKQSLRYEKALGRHATADKWTRVRTKLDWAFRGEIDTHESYTRSRPNVDGAVLGTLK